VTKLTPKQVKKIKVVELAGQLRLIEKGINPTNAKAVKEWRKNRVEDLRLCDKILAIIAPPKVKKDDQPAQK
jgi:hypothetical protein